MKRLGHRWAVALGVLWCAAPLAIADLDSVALLKNLVDPDYAVRQRASEQLLANEQLNPDKIKHLYRQSHLPEQRHRLLNAARHHALRQMRLETFSKKGRGAIGIRHEAFSAGQFPKLGQAGLIVVETYAGFPGHAHLRQGDLILAIDQNRFATTLHPDQIADRFIRMVQEHHAGKQIHLAVHRDGRTISIQMRLANLDALSAMYKNAQNLQKRFLDQWLTLRQSIIESPPQPRTVPLEIPQSSHIIENHQTD